MKKLFTLFFALLAFAYCAQAQTPVLSENFDSGMPTGWTQIDANNDNMGWEHSSNPASYFAAGVDLSGTGHNSSTGFVLSGSYSNVTSTAITPDNWLITPSITLTGACNLTFWVCAQDASYAAEHYGVYISTTGNTSTSDFTLLMEETIDANGGAKQGAWKQKTVNLANYAGQTVYIAFRHFNCNDMFVLNLDDVEVVAQPTTPTIVPGFTSLDLGTVLLGSTADAQVSVMTYNLTADVTATTAAPFTVSANGTSFNTTATIPATGGTLYVRYAPTTAGTNNGTVTLVSAGAPNATISLTGEGLDCGNTPIPYHFDFDNEGVECWTIIDANNDGSTFNFDTEDAFAYYIYSSSNAADDWLISPAFNFNGNYHGSVDYAAISSYYPERFQVFLIDANNNTTALTGEIEVTEEDFATQGFNIPSVNGSYRIGLHAISDADEYALLFTNFNIMNGVSVEEFSNETIIFPNPANNVLNINANSNISRVEVFNMMGQMVGSYTANDVNTQINTANFANGVYTVRIATENGTVTKKFTVAR